jgi:hypothetical protein
VQGSRSAELDLRPFQITNLDGPQTMPERDQDQRGVAVGIARPYALDEIVPGNAGESDAIILLEALFHFLER